METKSFIRALLTGLALLTCTDTQAILFTYQGRLNDGAGPAGGIYDLRFAIYDSASGGAQQGPTFITNAVAVNNGLFAVALGFGSVFDGNARWLEIAVRPAGGGAFTLLSPRQPLTATPCALYAPNAGTAANVLGSVSASQITGRISSSQIAAGAGRPVPSPPSGRGSLTRYGRNTVPAPVHPRAASWTAAALRRFPARQANPCFGISPEHTEYPERVKGFDALLRPFASYRVHLYLGL